MITAIVVLLVALASACSISTPPAASLLHPRILRYTPAPQSPRSANRIVCRAGRTPDLLSLDQPEILMARQLRHTHPFIPAHEIAQRIPASSAQRDLIVWMRDDLGRYVNAHADVWDNRLQLNPNLEAEFKKRSGPHLYDRDEAARALEKMAEAATHLDLLTVRDFHRFLSVFLQPDHAHGLARYDITTERRPHSVKLFRDWPRTSFVVTQHSVSVRQRALSTGLGAHYIGLISHLGVSYPQGEPYFTLDCFKHDLCRAGLSLYKVCATDDWAAIHAAYIRWQQDRSPYVCLLDDLAYFYKTHELVSSVNAIYSNGRLLERYRSEWEDEQQLLDQLRASVDAVDAFWHEHVVRPRQKQRKMNAGRLPLRTIGEELRL